MNAGPRRACDALIVRDFVLTMDAARRMPTDGATAILGGRVAAVGPTREVEAAAPSRRSSASRTMSSGDGPGASRRSFSGAARRKHAVAWSGGVLGQDGVTASCSQGMLDTSRWTVAKQRITGEQRGMLRAWLGAQTSAGKRKRPLDCLPCPGPSPLLTGRRRELRARLK